MKNNASNSPTGLIVNETNDEEFGGKFLSTMVVQALWEIYQITEGQAIKRYFINTGALKWQVHHVTSYRPVATV